jgi:hypothetical protein
VKPHLAPLGLLLLTLALTSCSVHVAPYHLHTEGDESAQVGEAAPKDPTGVAQAVMAAKLRIILKNPDLMGQDANFETLRPYLVLALASRPQTLQELEEAAGQKILSLGKYPEDLVPEDTLVYANNASTKPQ